MFIEKENVIGNTDNRIQAGLNIIVHISHIHYSDIMCIFSGGNQLRLAFLSLATAQYNTKTVIVADRLITKSHVDVSIVTKTNPAFIASQKNCCYSANRGIRKM